MVTQPEPGIGAEPMRIYLHAAGATLNTSKQFSKHKVCRHDLVVILGQCCEAGFSIHTATGSQTLNAIAIAPSQRYSVVDMGLPLIRLVVPLTHPRFNALRLSLKEAFHPLDRAAFSHLDAYFQAAYDGLLDAKAASEVMEAMMDVMLAGRPKVPPLDRRVVRALRHFASDVDYPFGRVATELNLSPSRLSHLFSEHLGISMRGCQAWARMAFAWELVVWRRDLSFTEVAHLMKFSDSSHLARAFKSAYGLSPSHFRSDTLEVIGQPATFKLPPEAAPKFKR